MNEQITKALRIPTKNANNHIVFNKAVVSSAEDLANKVCKYANLSLFSLDDEDRKAISDKYDELDAKDAPKAEKFILTDEVLIDMLNELGVTFNVIDQIWIKNGHERKVDEVAGSLARHLRNFKGVSMTVASLRDIMNQYAEAYKDKTESDTDKHIAYDGNDDWREVVSKLYDFQKIKNCSKDAFGLALRQWCWQTKRRWFAKTCTNQLALNFFTTHQGVGKTDVTNAIAKSIFSCYDYWTTTSVGEIVDETRTYDLFFGIYIAILDEWTISCSDSTSDNSGKMDSDKYETLKKKITANNPRKGRVMGGGSTSHTKFTASIIGSSNRHYWTIFPKVEEQRRFVEFEVGRSKTDLSNEDYRAFIKYIEDNFSVVMRSVDENNPDGYFKCPDYKAESNELEAMQDKVVTAMKAKDNVVKFVEYVKNTEDFGRNYRELNDWESFYHAFAERCRATGVAPKFIPQLENFKIRVLDELGLDCEKGSLEEAIVKMGKVDVASETSDPCPFDR